MACQIFSLPCVQTIGKMLENIQTKSLEKLLQTNLPNQMVNHRITLTSYIMRAEEIPSKISKKLASHRWECLLADR